jgi:hypothetical protein
LLALFNQADYVTIELEHAKADAAILTEAVKTDAGKQGQLDQINRVVKEKEEWLANLDASITDLNDFVNARIAEVV